MEGYFERQLGCEKKVEALKMALDIFLSVSHFSSQTKKVNQILFVSLLSSSSIFSYQNFSSPAT